MWRGFIATTLVLWSSGAFAERGFGIKTGEAIDLIRETSKARMTLEKCDRENTCTYFGEETPDRVSIWSFSSSDDGYLRTIGLVHATRPNLTLPGFDDPSMRRAQDFIWMMVMIACNDAIQADGRPAGSLPRQVIDLGNYVNALIHQKPLPKSPDDVRVTTKTKSNQFMILMQHID